jgi:MscS family membrane protein
MEFLEFKVLQNTILDYLISLGIFVLVLLTWVVVYRLGRRHVKALVERTETEVDNLILERLYSPLTFVVLIIGIALATDHLKFPPSIRFWTERIFLVLGLVVFFLIMSRLLTLFIDLTAEGYAKRLRDKEPEDLESRLRRVERLRRQVREIARMLVAAFACLTILSNLGINLRAVWASLGIGGIALALAVQEPLRNLIGRAYIFFTGIFDEGHFILFDKWSGTVLKISAFRTYIELFSDMTTVSIPNADFIKGVVKNYYGRTKFMYKWDLDVPYDVQADGVRKLVANLRELLLEKPEVSPERCWVYLERLGAHSKVVRVWFQANLPAWSDSLFYGNAVLYDIQLLFESMGLPFAFPTQTLMLETERPLTIREQTLPAPVVLPDPDDSSARH